MSTCYACGNRLPCPCGNLLAAFEAVFPGPRTPTPPDRRPEEAWVADDRRIQRAEVDRMFDARWGR